MDTSSSFVKTFNNMGYMTTTVDKFTQSFIDFCSPSMTVFEGGAAFGVATRGIIEKGCKVYVNDLAKEHLEIILEKATPEQKEKILIFPGEIQNLSFEDLTFDGIFSSRMIHLLKGNDIEKTLSHFFKWLKPNGKLVITADTPFLKCYSSNLKKYESRRQQGDKWPGLIEDTSEFMGISFNNIPKFINFLDLETLTRAISEEGFTIEKAEYIDQTSFPEDLKFDGRETIGVIAHKPVL